MTNKTVLIDAIKVDKRRRQDFGDIKGLAESIKSHGLLHPPVVDDRLNLVAGERRLRACKLLEWASIEVRPLGELTAAERSEIELEENLQRKDLTAEERSKTLVALAEKAAEIDRQGFRADSARNPSGGRPEKAGSLRRVSERIGVPAKTIHDAQKHVAAVERYPVLAPITQADAMVVAKKLDEMPTPVREKTLEAVQRHEPGVMAKLTDRPPLPKGPTPHQMSATDPGRQFIKGFHDLTVHFNSVRDHGGIRIVSSTWSRSSKQQFLEDVSRVVVLATEWRDALETDLDGAQPDEPRTVSSRDPRSDVGVDRSAETAA